MNSKNPNSTKTAKERIKSDRKRSNILKKGEANLIAYLVQRIPRWISSDMMTAIGFFGNLMVCAAFVLAAYLDRNFLLLGPVGFMVSWFGDSLDGRMAYYRNTPRKWYGFSLDVTVDWIGTLFIGMGFMLYMQGPWMFIGYAFVVLYGWEMITKILGFKILGKYSIDSGGLGPTEVRIIIAFFMMVELFFEGSVKYFGLLAVIVLFTFNLKDFLSLLKEADQRDVEERKKKNAG